MLTAQRPSRGSLSPTSASGCWELRPVRHLWTPLQMRQDPQPQLWPPHPLQRILPQHLMLFILSRPGGPVCAMDMPSTAYHTTTAKTQDRTVTWWVRKNCVRQDFVFPHNTCVRMLVPDVKYSQWWKITLKRALNSLVLLFTLFYFSLMDVDSRC